MLTHVHIQNFAIIDNLDLELSPGMTIITGETGAGKSIMIDALDIALGDRADSNMIREGTDRYEIHLSFDIRCIPTAKEWLAKHELLIGDECIIRRTVFTDSRSRHFINGNPVTLPQLRELGYILVHIHGQHQHHALLKKEEQRDVLDTYADHSELLINIKSLFEAWRGLQKQKKELTLREDSEARHAFLQYQVQELKELNLQPDELDNLDKEHKQLANADQLILSTQECVALLLDDPEQAIQPQLYNAFQTINEFKNNSVHIQTACELLNSAIIDVEEATNELKQFLDKIDLNPARLQDVETRLAQIHHLARKHRIKPQDLLAHYENLQHELSELGNRDELLLALQKEEEVLLKEYTLKANQLSEQRLKAAKKLNSLITKSMQVLGMIGGEFKVACEAIHTEPQPYGFDQIEFLVAANKGQTLKPLAKAASGGELSRISLAIQVVTAKKDRTPTLVFDEVDVGIGGPTAEIVGKLLRQLSQNAQVLCITHLAQVASLGHHHLKIDKESVRNNTTSKLIFLSKEERIQEIARMLGGIEVTKQSLLHAKEMLNKSLNMPSKVEELV